MDDNIEEIRRQLAEERCRREEAEDVAKNEQRRREEAENISRPTVPRSLPLAQLRHLGSDRPLLNDSEIWETVCEPGQASRNIRWCSCSRESVRGP